MHEAAESVPQLHLRHHITPDVEAEDFDFSGDSDVQSTREIVEKSEEPGMDALRGTFGAIGTIIRAKRRMRALSAASHGTQSSTSHHSAEIGRSRTSTHVGVRPSWLTGHWATPKASRFQPMHDDKDLEKGHVEIVEARDEKMSHFDSSTSLTSAGASPISFPRSPSPLAMTSPGATSSQIPLSALHAQPSTISGHESVSTESLDSISEKHGGESLTHGNGTKEKDRLA